MQRAIQSIEDTCKQNIAVNKRAAAQLSRAQQTAAAFHGRRAAAFHGRHAAAFHGRRAAVFAWTSRLDAFVSLSAHTSRRSVHWNYLVSEDASLVANESFSGG